MRRSRLLREQRRPNADLHPARAAHSAISAGSSAATPSSTRRNTAGASRSRACARRSSPTSPTRTIRSRERCWIAEMNGENVGCVMLVKDDPTRLRASPAAGRSEGARARARRAAGRRVRHLRAPRRLRRSPCGRTASSPPRVALYEKAGFTLTSSEQRHTWGKDVVAEYLGSGFVVAVVPAERERGPGAHTPQSTERARRMSPRLRGDDVKSTRSRPRAQSAKVGTGFASGCARSSKIGTQSGRLTGSHSA